jgi:hypothetical protein
MTIGAGLFLIAVGAILRFGVTTAFTHGFSVHTIGDILMIVGALGVVLWLIVWAPWSRGRRSAYREAPPPDEIHDEVYTTRRYPGDGPPYGDHYPR